jgi:chromate transporter
MQEPPSPSQSRESERAPQGSAIEVLRVFTWLGLTSFGGPIAHLGYFRAELVERRKWLDERAYADLVGLSQFLPGPASSKVGFSLGMLRTGYLGGIAAWVGFTLPSAVLMMMFAYGAGALADTTVGAGLLHGLKLVAVAIVSHAVWGMARTLCPDLPRICIAAIAAVLVTMAPAAAGQLGAIALGALLGWGLCRGDDGMVAQPLGLAITRRAGLGALVLFFFFLAASFVVEGDGPVAMFSAFYRSGALVFGGGHVVLPLLSEAVVTPGWVSQDMFMAGYGAAQALPGPLFTFAAYLGAQIGAPGRELFTAALALIAIFIPGLLLQLAAFPFWDAFRSRRSMQSAMRGINAAVVGLLAAALYDPVFVGSVFGPVDLAIAVVGFVLLVAFNVPPLAIVVLCAGAGVGAAVLS